MLGSQFLAALKLNKMKKQVPNSNELKGLKIAINMVRPLEANFSSEGYLGLLLGLHGAKVRIYHDDGALYHWDKIQKDDPNPLNLKSKFDLELYLSEKILKWGWNHSNVKYFSYSKLKVNECTRNYFMDMISENVRFLVNRNKVQAEHLVQWVQDVALTSTIRYFKTEDLNFENERILNYFKKSIVNAMLSWRVAEDIDNTFHPDIFMTNHGIYSTFYPAVRYFRKKGIKTLILGGPNLYSKDYSKCFFGDTSIQQLSTSKYWKEWREKNELTDSQEKKVFEWFQARFNFLTADHRWLKYMKNNVYQLENIQKQYRLVIGIFPNVIWDGNIVNKWGDFDGILDWICFTLNHFKNQKDVFIILKPHPGELTFCKKGERTLDSLRKMVNFKEFENLLVMKPEWRINVYELIPKLDVGIVWDGILALEMPLMGVPSITVAKNGLFTVPGTIMMDGKKKTCASCLNNLDLVIKQFKEHEKEHLTDILKYAYWFLNIEGIHVPAYTYNEKTGAFIRNFHLIKKKHFQLTSRMKQFFI